MSEYLDCTGYVEYTGEYEQLSEYELDQMTSEGHLFAIQSYYANKC